jgi:hypothetical protein
MFSQTSISLQDDFATIMALDWEAQDPDLEIHPLLYIAGRQLATERESERETQSHNEKG